jgi:hypothetical protein
MIEVRKGAAHFDGLCIKLEPILIDQELLDVLALISLQLNHLAHLTVVDDRPIASYHRLASCIIDVTSPRSLPNFFLITLRIFFWSNFFGNPCTVVNVLRPLRSGIQIVRLCFQK